MTISELRETNDYKQAIRKVQGYPQGFKFTLNYSVMPIGKANALKILMEDCINYNLDETESTCMWCEENGFDILYEIIG